MARRREDQNGVLVYQEGKCIEGEYYVVAVFDELDTCCISFSAYELENDCTYTYSVTYEEFDEFFKYNVELMNPSNIDARFHWVIERLDFVTDPMGQKQLCLSDEPTLEVAAVVESEDEQAAEEADAVAAGAEDKLAEAASGLLDAQTRARLLRELDCKNYVNVQKGLVRSEHARRKFLEELFKKRQLEQLKAQQRLQKNDAERQARMAKLVEGRRKQQEKSQRVREKEEAQKSTMMQLEALKRQKQAADIRKLIASRGDGGEGDQRRQENRARKQKQQNAERERLAAEKQRDEQLARNREIAVQKREQEIKNRDRAEADKVRDRREAERMVQVRRREEKDLLIVEVWRLKTEARLQREANRDEFFRLEDRRDERNAGRERTRAMNERQRRSEKLEHEQIVQEKVELRRRAEQDEALLRWRVQSSQRAIAVRHNAKRTANRLTKLMEKDDMRLRKFRETQFLETMRSHTSGGPSATQDMRRTGMPDAASALETTQVPANVSYEQQERARRLAEQEARRKLDEAKKGKVDKLGAQNPNLAEVAKFREWKKQEEKRQQQLERLREEHELREDLARKEKAAQIEQREEAFKAAAPIRRQSSLERRQARNEKMVRHIQKVPIGCGLPVTFVY